MAQTATTAPLDRWDLIADRLWQIPELGWAIAEANPDLAGYLVLPAGLPLVVPELRSLRRPLTAANPAREDDGDFQALPPDTPRPITPPSGGGGSIVLPLAINQGGTGGVSAQDALNNLGAVALNAVGVSIAPLVAGLVPVSNLPTFQAPISFPIAINQGGTGSTTASAGLSALGGIAASQRGIANGIAPLDSNNLVPVGNLPPYPTLSSLEAIPTSAIGITVAPLTSGLVPASNLPPYPTLTSLGAMAASNRGATNGVAPLVSGLVPVANLPTYPTLASLGGIPLTQKGAASGVAALDANSLLSISNIPLNTAFPFTAGASFRGGTSPGITPTLVQATVDASGQPRYWLVNANAPVNNRIKSITVTNNGNVQIRHHNDNLTDGNVLEYTATGNLLTTGTLRCGSGTVNFTGANFVPGALYFRSDIAMLLYSDGTNWRRMDTNAIVT